MTKRKPIFAKTKLIDVKKAKKPRRREDKLGDDLADLGILAARLEIVEKNEAKGSFVGKLPSASFAEFMDLGGRLHRRYLRFGARDKTAADYAAL